MELINILLFSSNFIEVNKNIFFMLIIFLCSTLHDNTTHFIPVSYRMSNREHSEVLRNFRFISFTSAIKTWLKITIKFLF